MFPPADIVPLTTRIAEILKTRGETLAVSESACGGLISSYLVALPRASQFFVGGTTSYSLRSRLHLSGWSQEDIDSYTGPSENVVKRLARNLKLELGATYALAETGWAGPSATPEDAVGNVYIGIAAPNGQESVVRHTNVHSRCENMEQFARLALEFLLAALEEKAQ